MVLITCEGHFGHSCGSTLTLDSVFECLSRQFYATGGSDKAVCSWDRDGLSLVKITAAGTELKSNVNSTLSLQLKLVKVISVTGSFDI